MDLFASRPRPNVARVAQLKQWVTDDFGLPPASAVLVTELTCKEAGCPPLETVVAVLEEDGTRWQHTFHKALDEVTRDEIARLPALRATTR